VDFWNYTNPKNLKNRIGVFLEMEYALASFPEPVGKKEQNISVKFSPVDLNLELITRFEIGKTFDQAFTEGEEVQSKKDGALKWRVLIFDDLIESKRRAARPKDLLDILQLQSLNGEKPDS
jgi:hypothetical protein